jgi:glycosyltransferase involved in cell wall biosynthesis
MKSPSVLTNSEYNRRAIFKTFGIDNAIVVSPPVDVDSFRNRELSSSFSCVEREDVVLVVCRIDRVKKVENAIELAKLLKENNIGTGMKIVGSLDIYYFVYYYYLKKIFYLKTLIWLIMLHLKLMSVLINCFRLCVRVKYTSTQDHKNTGISIVEAMSAGLIPIVPTTGEQTEFVPCKYHFNTLKQAAQIASSAFNIPGFRTNSD